MTHVVIPPDFLFNFVSGSKGGDQTGGLDSTIKFGCVSNTLSDAGEASPSQNAEWKHMTTTQSVDSKQISELRKQTSQYFASFFFYLPPFPSSET